jgi:alanyl-tRNA synthetase
MGSVSCELCGGTHVKSTGNIGLFKIISESSVAAGVRRIEGTTGFGVLNLLASKDCLLAETAHELKAGNVQELPKRAAQLREELKEAARKLESANSKIVEAQLDSILSSAEQKGDLRYLTAKLSMKPDAARTLCDSIKERHPDMVAVFALIDEDKLNFIACCGADAVKKGAHAGQILREVSAVTGGKGGGRPDSAMSGGKELTRVDDALALVKTLIP